MSFIILILSLYRMFWSVPDVVFTLFLSIPFTVYRVKLEDRQLREKFGEQWEITQKKWLLSPEDVE